MIRRARCSNYLLVNDVEMEEEISTNVHECPCYRYKKKCIILTLVVLSLLLLAFLVIFVILPLIFKYSINFQRHLIFTRFNLPENEEYFTTYKFPSFQNHYVKVKNGIFLGVWHILPDRLAYAALHEPNFDYKESFNSPYPVVIYFHGAGETRADNGRKYQLLTQVFHVIAFDYRSYGDSTKADLYEEDVVSDCFELYDWVRTRTDAPIYFWGHSLGAALAAHTAAISDPAGLIIESGFTSLRSEMFVHPFGKLFSWLAWYNATILDPLEKNGFIFNTAGHISKLKCPIMILHAQDDTVIPVKFGKELFCISSLREPRERNATIYHEFDKEWKFDHNSITNSPFLKYYIMEFLGMAEKLEGHQTHVEIYFDQNKLPSKR